MVGNISRTAYARMFKINCRRTTLYAVNRLTTAFTAKRWELLKAMCGAGPMSIREVARRVGRDVKAVHGDVTALLNVGVLSRSPEGRVEFPFDSIKVEFILQAA